MHFCNPSLGSTFKAFVLVGLVAIAYVVAVPVPGSATHEAGNPIYKATVSYDEEMPHVVPNDPLVIEEVILDHIIEFTNDHTFQEDNVHFEHVPIASLKNGSYSIAFTIKFPNTNRPTVKGKIDVWYSNSDTKPGAYASVYMGEKYKKDLAENTQTCIDLLESVTRKFIDYGSHGSSTHTPPPE
ncbi:hypothetical protein J3R30DRAFT_3438722 [Lentinula aciculospora]|uniref:Uncharacterized protein n=1 Tax=Lentinula aciculospora TaxID=153920 RepID=A0A9W9AND1_9AGAR|nr:hypothetical protein J3R30DRAFT_3438722 [Lentinula aciculospora]